MARREDALSRRVRVSMQCRQCGAATRPGMAQCPNCGAQLTKQDDSSFEANRPQQRYIPGGVSASNAPSAPPSPAPDQSGQRRPQGSLGRRLQQQSAASSARGEPSGPDDVYPPRRGGDEMRPSQRGGDDVYPPPQRGARSRPRPDEREPSRGYAPPEERGRERRPSTDGRRRGRAYDDGDDGYDRYGGENGDDRDSRDYDDDAPNEAPGWAEGRDRRMPSRRPRDRGAPLDDAGEEMIARREAPRSGPTRRRGAPEPPGPAWDDAASPLDDPRAPPGLLGLNRSGPSRQSRTSGPPGSSRGRGPSRYESDPRRESGRYDPPAGYTDEEPAVRYGEDESEGYSEEYPARPRFPDDRRGPPSGARGPRSAPGASRTPGRRVDDNPNAYDAYDPRENFGRAGEYGRAPGRTDRDPRAMGGFDGRYADVPSYNDVAQGYPPVSRGGQMGYGPRDDFDASRAWEPGGLGGPYAGAPGPRGAIAEKAPAKSQNGVFALAFRLLTTVIVVVGLIVVVGPELKPALGKYLPFLQSGTQTTPPPAFATYTPGPTPTNLPNYKLFTSTANGYAMDYPSSWGTTTLAGANSDSVNQFAQPNSAAQVNVERSAGFDSATDEQVILAEVQGAQKQGMTITEITGAATTEGVGGEVWQRHEYQATTKSGTKLHIAILVCHHLGKGYVIALISSDTSFTNDDTTTFEPMLRSFRFL